MVTHIIIPIHEIVKILESRPVIFVSIVPFFKFAIGLRMIHPRFDMLDFGFFQEGLESTLCISIFILFVGIKLRTSIGKDFADIGQPFILGNGLLQQFYGIFCRGLLKFATGQDKSRAIVKNCTHLRPVDVACMPIKVY